MKKLSLILIATSLVALLINSCSIERRYHRTGFNVNWNNSSVKIKKDKNSNHYEIDNQLVEWFTQYKIPPLNLAAVILARLTWMAKMSDCKEDFLSLLEAPRDILENEDNEKQIH